MTKESIKKIRKRIGDARLIIIDEVSMVTPILLARIDSVLRQLKKSTQDFGGLHIVLVGDFLQLPPIAWGDPIKKTLFDNAVRLSTQRQMKSPGIIQGTQLFQKFIKFDLFNIERCKDEQHKQLMKDLRNFDKTNPITPEMLKSLKILKAKDLKEDPEWEFAPIIVTTNLTRQMINHKQILRFATKYNKPILSWTTPIKSGNDINGAIHWQYYPNLNDHALKLFPMLIQYFVAGAECSIESTKYAKYGLKKGSTVKMLKLIWEKNNVDLTKLPVGEITKVERPTYIIIETKSGQLIPINYETLDTNKSSSNPNKNITYQAHPLQLLFSITFHKAQSRTMKKVILLLNSRKCSRRLCQLSYQSFVVGTTRVRDGNDLRIFELSQEDIEQLCKLQIPPTFVLWFRNHDKNGKWIPNGLQQINQSRQNHLYKSLHKHKTLSDLTVKAMQYFCREFDIPFKSNDKKAQLMKLLQPIFAECQNLDITSTTNLASKIQKQFLIKMQNGNLNSFTTSTLNSYAIVFGIQCSNTSRKNLINLLSKTIKKK